MPNGRPRGPAIQGSELRQRRERLGLRKTELAARCGRSARYIADLEKERYSPSIEALHRLATALNCDVTDLLTPGDVAA